MPGRSTRSELAISGDATSNVQEIIRAKSRTPFEKIEVLNGMDDAAFWAASVRTLASLRKIFSTQQKNWATSCLRSNLQTVRAGSKLLVERLSVAQPSGSIVDRYGTAQVRRSSDDKALVTLKRFRAHPHGGTVEEKFGVRPVALCQANNVPPYTHYIYSVSENSYVRDELRRRLLFPDHDGEMRVASDSDADLDLWSDAVSEEEETVTGQSEITEGVEKDETRERCAKHPRSEFRSHNQKTAISQKDEARRKKIEADVERAAKGPWDHKDDFLIFASSVILGTSVRAIDTIAMHMKISSALLRARLNDLEQGIHACDNGVFRRASAIATVYEHAKKLEEVEKSSSVADSIFHVGASGESNDPDFIQVDGYEIAPKFEFDGSDDEHRDLGNDGLKEDGLELKEELAQLDGAATKELKSKQTAFWNLVAWKFLSENSLVPVDEHPAYSHIDTALDSFRALYCARCHTYDCNLHGCGQDVPLVKFDQPTHLRPHVRVCGTAMKDAKSARLAREVMTRDVSTDDSPDRIGAIGRGGRARALQTLISPPCGPDCWRLHAVRNDESLLSPPEFDAVAIKAEALREMAAKDSTVEFEGTDFLNDPTVQFARIHDDNNASEVPWVKWSEFEESYYKKIRSIFNSSSKSVEPCTLARVMGTKSCKLVYAHLRSDLREESVSEAERACKADRDGLEKDVGGGRGNAFRRGRRGRKKTSKFTSQRKRTTATIRRRMSCYEDLVWTQYTPCECGDGPCIARTCGCMRDGNFCEKFCACRGQCVNKFVGCACKTGTCRTRACPCFAASRECDPDSCKRCTATAEIEAYKHRDGWPFNELCQPVPDAPVRPTESTRVRATHEQCMNMRLLLQHHKHVTLGLSAVSGWGAFLKNGAKKNELLGEYTGELISQAEADRRGKIYDRINLSFLFNLNDQWVLDAHLKGNKLKFANHSGNPNCYAKVLMVRGDHRVGIFAKRNIAPGEELMYDYR